MSEGYYSDPFNTGSRAFQTSGQVIRRKVVIIDPDLDPKTRPDEYNLWQGRKAAAG